MRNERSDYPVILHLVKSYPILYVLSRIRFFGSYDFSIGLYQIYLFSWLMLYATASSSSSSSSSFWSLNVTNPDSHQW